MQTTITEGQMRRMDLYVEEAELAMDAFSIDGDGRAESLSMAFHWSMSPQGSAFWTDESARLKTGMDLTSAARDALKSFIDMASSRRRVKGRC